MKETVKLMIALMATWLLVMSPVLSTYLARSLQNTYQQKYPHSIIEGTSTPINDWNRLWRW